MTFILALGSVWQLRDGECSPTEAERVRDVWINAVRGGFEGPRGDRLAVAVSSYAAGLAHRGPAFIRFVTPAASRGNGQPGYR
jgi:hypothetical protein